VLKHSENERLLALGGSKTQYYFNKFFFDLTCQWGMNYGRPLKILFWFWLACSLLYYLFIRLSRHSGLYVIPRKLKADEKARLRNIQKIKPRSISGAGKSRFIQSRLQQERRLLSAAMLFSLMSALNIGFRELNFGNWLRLATKREYDIKAVGWTRTLSAFQSLISVYLIALSVLTYFGRPFE
jgi:hypothetical protein